MKPLIKAHSFSIPLLFFLVVQFPSKASGQETCWTCLPRVGSSSICYPNQEDEGYDDCRGECDFSRGSRCDPEEQVAVLGSPVLGDSLEFPFNVRYGGKKLSADAFAVRNCDGHQIQVVYTETGIIRRQSAARRIKLTRTGPA